MNKKVLFVTTDYSYFTLPISQALNKLGYEVHIFDYYRPNLTTRLIGLCGNLRLLKKSRARVNSLVNKLLISTVRQLNPQYLLVIKGETITPETLDTINSSGTTTINWFGDGLFFWQWMKQTAAHYSIFINNGRDSFRKLNKFGVESYCLEYAGPDIRPRPRLSKKYSITFVGQHSPRRERYFKPLKTLGLKIWGYQQWQKSSLKDICEGPVPVKTAHQIIGESKIVVNTLTGNFRTEPEEINIRTFETLAMGTFLLVQDYPFLKKFFRVGKELVTFKTPSDLYQKAKYYLDHPKERETIAAAGYERIQKEHLFKHRLKDLFTIVKRHAH